MEPLRFGYQPRLYWNNYRQTPIEPSMIVGTYNFGLVALSILIAILAAYTALDLSGRVNAYAGRARLFWLSGGAAAMGSGIWAMHYVGMLALRMPIRIAYDVPTVAVSLFAAWLASLIALYTVSRPQLNWAGIAIGSVFMGAGIASMHYIGMFAMRMGACVHYDQRIVALSIVAAVGISAVALLLSFRLRNDPRNLRRKLVSALVMGSAIPVMHYLGMWAASFSMACHVTPDLSEAVEISSFGIAAIVTITVGMLVTVIVTSFLDRLLQAKRESLSISHESESNFRMMAEAIPKTIWTARADGSVEYFNRRWYDYTGQAADSGMNTPWETSVHPDDLPECEQQWHASLESGQTCEFECRLRAADSTYRWHLARIVPIKDADGKVTRWFGTFTDFEQQKRNQELLEAQVKERTGEIIAMNDRLLGEIGRREAARKIFEDESARLVESLRQGSLKAALLRKMGFLLQSCAGREEALQLISGFAPKLFPEYSGALCLLNASKTYLEVATVWGGCELPSGLSEPDSCWALRTGQVHSVEAGDGSAPCRHAVGVSKAYFCIPIVANGEAIGIVHLQHTQSALAAEESLGTPSTFAEHIGLSMSNLRLRELLRNQSIRDSLTGLFNRRYLEETYEREFLRAEREGKPVGIMMLDLDHFKDFNDTHGHGAGDAVLREFASVLSNSVRAGDVACRYGGEEFVLMLVGMTSEQMAQRGEKIRMRVKEINLEYQSKPLGTITTSIGVAVAPTHGRSFHHVIFAADHALYAAKKGGRDRVVAAEMPESGTASPEIPQPFEIEPRH